MHHIGYTSRAMENGSFFQLEQLCQTSAAHNKLVGVTGLLVFDSVDTFSLSKVRLLP
ncbi:MAG: hypothetical protein EOO61_11130 [Hymenobacter sp.]|nr:MAG: hypothetical protein EOO61_11130 [Hymenobacter sp.]